MSVRRDQDRCPECGNDDVTPFAFVFGYVELYGYVCPCGHPWLIIHAETKYGALVFHDVEGPAT
jgi:hypothetical protein